MNGLAMIPGLLPPPLSSLYARHALRRCARLGEAPRVSGPVWVHGNGEIVVGNRVFFDAAAAPIEIFARCGARIVIGDDVYIGGGTSIDATRSILIGARCHIGAFCAILDSHFHPLTGDRHSRVEGRALVLEDDVSLGPRAILLAGAHLGSGSRVGAATVVKRRTPPGTVTFGGRVRAPLMKES